MKKSLFQHFSLKNWVFLVVLKQKEVLPSHGRLCPHWPGLVSAARRRYKLPIHLLTTYTTPAGTAAKNTKHRSKEIQNTEVKKYKIEEEKIQTHAKIQKLGGATSSQSTYWLHTPHQPALSAAKNTKYRSKEKQNRRRRKIQINLKTYKYKIQKGCKNSKTRRHCVRQSTYWRYQPALSSATIQKYKNTEVQNTKYRIQKQPRGAVSANPPTKNGSSNYLLLSTFHMGDLYIIIKCRLSY